MTNPSEPPPLLPYRKHMIVCTGDKCAKEGVGSGLYEYLKERLRQLGLQEGPSRIHRSKSSCLGVCQQGPIAVVYPEGVWYCSLDRKRLDTIISRHLMKDQPVSEGQFHKLENHQ